MENLESLENMYPMHKDSIVVDIKSGSVVNKQLVPYALYSKDKQLLESEIYKWLSKRATPLTRKNANRIYQAVGQLREKAELGLMLQTHALSINDNYWIASKKDLDSLSWDSINLYKNKISDYMTRLAFTGQEGEGDSASEGEYLNAGELSPEFTGQGTYAKCFRRTSTGLEICKQGTIEEIWAELYSSIGCRLLGIPCVEYRAGKLFGIQASISTIATNEQVSWVSAFDFAHFVEEAYNEYIYNFAEKWFKVMYYALILIDGLFLNEDRHLQNWSIQVSGDTNEIQGMAPLYDFNKSFTGDSKSKSNFIERKNLLSAAREANKVLRLDLISGLSPLISKIPSIWQDSFYNRILYIMGTKSNQNDCY